MKCTQCSAPRTAWSKVCAYCGFVFPGHVDPPATAGERAPTAPTTGDDAFARLSADPRAQELLGDRSGLPDLARRSGLKNLLPLIITGALAAFVLWQSREPDGSYPGRALIVAAGFAAIGLFAVVRGARRAGKIAEAPVVASLVRLGVRDVTTEEPGLGDAGRGELGHGRMRWVLALEDGSQRYVWPAPGMRGREELRRGAAGVAWTKGPHLLGFARLEG